MRRKAILFSFVFALLGDPPLWWRLTSRVVLVPVIANSRGSIPEIAGNAAILLDPYDPTGLGEALKLLLENPSEREALAEKGRART